MPTSDKKNCTVNNNTIQHTKNNWHINKFTIINGPTATPYLDE